MEAARLHAASWFTLQSFQVKLETDLYMEGRRDLRGRSF